MTDRAGYKCCRKQELWAGRGESYVAESCGQGEEEEDRSFALICGVKTYQLRETEGDTEAECERDPDRHPMEKSVCVCGGGRMCAYVRVVQRAVTRQKAHQIQKLSTTPAERSQRGLDLEFFDPSMGLIMPNSSYPYSCLHQ